MRAAWAAGKPESRGNNGVEAAGGNDISGKWLPCVAARGPWRCNQAGRIVNLLRDGAEVATPLGHRRDGVYTGDRSLQLAKALIIGEKENLVVDDWPSHAAAKLVLVVRGL